VTTDRATPGYRAWYQRVRGRALRRLEQAHKTEYRRYLAEEQAADPFTPQDLGGR
jgi:hypothetical protein